MNLYGSHLPILLEVLKLTDKPVLELGAGDNSTRQINAYAKGNITTIEDTKEWLAQYGDLESERHTLLLMSEKEMVAFFEKDLTEWGLVFVDSHAWEGRVAAINKYKDTADYIVIHDVEYSLSENIFGKMIKGKRDFGEAFKQWIEFIPNTYRGPHTLLGSNKKNLKGIEAKGLIRFSERYL